MKLRALIGSLLLLTNIAVAQSSDGDAKTKQAILATARTVAAVRKMRDRLADPDSVRVASVIIYQSEPRSLFRCVIFRSRNEYGGMVWRHFINNAIDDTAPGSFDEDGVAWPIFCKGTVVQDATEAVKAALKADQGKE